jgi:NAD(P)-dependent dehydrogenase (short-subunit alcohol dehydrogenase family)
MGCGESGKTLSGKRAVVIGGTGGIGRAVSLALAEAGAGLSITGGRSAERLDAMVRTLKGKGVASEGVLRRIDGPNDLGAAADVCVGADILVVAYGPFARKPVAESGAKDWIDAAVLNLALPGSCVSAALPGMADRRFGRIILFGGTGTDLPRPVLTNCAYAAAKTGLGVVVKTVAAEFADRNVAALLICPGFTETEYLSEADKTALRAKSPTETLVKPEEIARIVVDFAVQNPAVLNGIVLPADFGNFFNTRPG